MDDGKDEDDYSDNEDDGDGDGDGDGYLSTFTHMIVYITYFL